MSNIQATAIRQALNIAWAAARGQCGGERDEGYVRCVDEADRELRELVAAAEQGRRT